MHATASGAALSPTRPSGPLVIGHRGAPAYRPEHTEASFELAIDLGAEMIEPDVVLSRDGALVVRHERELSLSTDVATRPEFAHRRASREVDGVVHDGWFTEDFTLAELRTLRAVERIPELRPLNTAYDGEFGVLTLADVVGIARRRSTATRPVRVLAELKTDVPPSADGSTFADLVARELHELDSARADGTVVLQSFDTGLLRDLRARLGEDGPVMVQLIHDPPEWDRRVGRAGLREISTYAQGIGPSKDRLLLGGTRPRTGGAALVTEAHRAQLAVVCWTLRAENAFLVPAHQRGSAPAGLGDAAAEARALLDLGVDGLITDSPDVAVRAVAEFAAVPVPA